MPQHPQHHYRPHRHALPPPLPSPCPQANEQDLWALFYPVGEVLELAILRSQGRSKGCAFLTYATRQQVRTSVLLHRLAGGAGLARR